VLFNSFEFLFLFLPFTLMVFFVIGAQQHHRVAVSWLISASLFFYAWWNPTYLGLLIFSLLFNYSMGIILSSKNKSKPILTIGVILNLGFLAYFKYTNFLIENMNYIFNENYNLDHIILPLAISFFTFQQIAYLVDAYRGETREYNFLHYSLFVTFFPQLIAGPIVHHKEILPQFALKETYRINTSNINIGLSIFIIGLFKKVVLADSIAEYSTPVFSAADSGSSISFFEAWGGALAYSLQLYFDFSGYADMAVGVAKMFGIDLPINFNSPYKSKNIILFWRRWHMTLSRFLKDYLYIPLGGSRKGSRHINLFITMFLGGLWHGASYNFVVWGTLHGMLLIINNLWISFRQCILKHNVDESSYIAVIISTLATFLAVTITWVFFRAETLEGAMHVLKGMAGLNGLSLPDKLSGIIPDALSKTISFQTGGEIGSFPSLWGFVLITSLLFIIFFTPNTQEIINKYLSPLASNTRGIRTSERFRNLIAILIGLALFASIKAMLSANDSEFLYFNF
jgi:alginate O-acetyltransferase complex protein AlgI